MDALARHNSSEMGNVQRRSFLFEITQKKRGERPLFSSKRLYNLNFCIYIVMCSSTIFHLFSHHHIFSHLFSIYYFPPTTWKLSSRPASPFFPLPPIEASKSLVSLITSFHSQESTFFLRFVPPPFMPPYPITVKFTSRTLE